MDPAACRTAIAAKQRQAAERGNPWRSTTTMVRSVIPLDEWRTLVRQNEPRPKPVVSDDCGNPEPHGKHTVDTDQHRVVC